LCGGFRDVVFAKLIDKFAELGNLALECGNVLIYRVASRYLSLAGGRRSATSKSSKKSIICMLIGQFGIASSEGFLRRHLNLAQVFPEGVSKVITLLPQGAVDVLPWRLLSSLRPPLGVSVDERSRVRLS
jgi:hypothetical protein